VLSNARILVVVFAVSVAISLAWQYHAAQRGAVDSGTADQVAALDEAGVETAAHDLQHNDSQVSTRHPRDAASGDAKAKNKERAGEESHAAIQKYEDIFVYEYDEAWVGELYTRVHSPDPLPAEESEALSVISGRVLTPNGRPVEGVEVTAQFRDYFKGAGGSAETMAPSRPRKTKTNEEGFYAFEGLSEGTYMIGTKESSQYAVARREVHTGVKYADLVLDPQRFAIVRGVVTDPMGTELEQVRIMPLTTGLPAGTTTDSNGGFAIGVALEEGARGIPLRFRLDGFREQRYEVTEVDMAVADSVQIAVTMDPVHEYSTVAGSVSDTTRFPVAGETVRLYSPSLKRNYRAVTDDGGEYEFARVEIANDYQLWVRPTGPYRDFTEQNIALTPGSVRRDIELDPLNRDYRLSGRILDQDGKPVPNMTLTLRSMAAAAQKLPITSNAHGEFEVEDVPEGELVFESRTTPFYTLTGVHLSGNDKDREVDLVVPRGPHKLVGEVVDGNGRPISTRKIFISSAQVIEGISTRLSSSTSADAKGRFVFTDLGAGEHIVTVNAPGYEGVRLHHEIGPRSGNLVVRLEQQSTAISKASL
jgi:protocatechuate 3,4-dioxygenase beta subunit